MEEIGISELKKLTQVIKTKFDYDFSNYASSSFKRRVARILEIKKIQNVEILIDRISTNAISKEELLKEITVNVTEMFRDPSFWKALRQLITETLASKEKIKIWHAGCSSGEEVFSMLILLKELNLLNKTEIVATDINKGILEKAAYARIPNKNMELNEGNYNRFTGKSQFTNYFTKDGDNYDLDRSLLEKVSFKGLDLVQAKTFTKFDLILCRNVLIYFNPQLQNDVLSLLHNSLFLSGFIALGSKETMSWCQISNKFINYNIEEKIYKKSKE